MSFSTATPDFSNEIKEWWDLRRAPASNSPPSVRICKNSPTWTSRAGLTGCFGAPDAAEFTSSRRQTARFEKSCRPQPFADSNGDRPRAVSDSEKNQILAAYGWPTNTKKSSGEFDHWLPHWMGGSGGTKNIWFEPHAGKFGSRTKDKVELMLWRRVCVDKSMTLAEAKSQYLQGWTRLIPKEMIDVLYA